MNKVYYIALNTFRESVRSKILYSVLFFAVLLVLGSALLASVTIGDRVTVIKDFGLMSISLFTVAYAVISGSALLYKELSRKTVYNILSKPVSRLQFITGKYFGMFFTSLLMLGSMGMLLVGFAYMFEDSWDFYILLACFYMALELAIVCAAAIFFSSILVTPALSGILTFCLFLTGRSLGYLRVLVETNDLSEPMAYLLTALYWILPDLEKLNIINNVVYGFYPPPSHLVLSIAYSASYVAAFMVVSGMIFRNREFN